jgi:hypothetical protein
MYYTDAGEEITREEIARAVQERRAVIRWGHVDWANVASLMVMGTPKQAEQEAGRDTRGQCYSMWEEVWSELATDAVRAYRAASGRLHRA